VLCVAQGYEFLRRHSALLVHFSGTPKGAGSNFEYWYPADLQRVIKLEAASGVSCSAVRPGDEFDDFNTANATGCIGVVLGLQDKDSLVAADPHDCGSRMEGGVREVFKKRGLTIDDLEETFVKRPNDSYNEWVIKDYVVLGIFAAPPFRVSVLKVPDFPDDLPPWLMDSTPIPAFEQVSVAQLIATFPDLTIFSFLDGNLVSLTEKVVTPVKHSDIYNAS
jgi:hypothetical protein